MGSSYSLEELKEHVQGLKLEVERFEGTIATKRYQKLQKKLIETNATVLKMKKYNAGKNSREYDQMLNELSVYLKILTTKVTGNKRESKTQEETQEWSTVRRPKRDPSDIIDEYEKEIQAVEIEIQNAMQAEDVKKCAIVEAKLKIFYTQLAITKVENRSPLDARRNALFQKLVHCYKLLKKDAAHINQLLGTSADETNVNNSKNINYSDVDSDFDSDFDSEFNGSHQSDWSRSGSVRSTLQETSSITSENPTIPPRNSKFYVNIPVRKNSECYKDHTYENMEVVLREKRKLIQADMNPTVPARNSKFSVNIPVRKNSECYKDHTYENMEVVLREKRKPTQADSSRTKNLENTAVKKISIYNMEESLTDILNDDDYNDVDLYASLARASVVEEPPKQNVESSLAKPRRKVNPPKPKYAHDATPLKGFTTEDEAEEKEKKKPAKGKTGKIRPPVVKQTPDSSGSESSIDNMDRLQVENEQKTKIMENKSVSSKIKKIRAPVLKVPEDEHMSFDDDSDLEDLENSEGSEDHFSDQDTCENTNENIIHKSNVSANSEDMEQTRYLSDDDDSDEDYPEALNLELLNIRSAYSGRLQASALHAFEETEEKFNQIDYQTFSEKEEDQEYKSVPNNEEDREEEQEEEKNYSTGQNNRLKDHNKFSQKEEVQYINEEIKPEDHRPNIPRIEITTTEDSSTNTKLHPANKTGRKANRRRIAPSVDYTQQINEVLEAVEDLKAMNEEFQSTKDYKLYADIQEKLMKTIKSMFNMNKVNFDKKSLILYDIVSKDIQSFVNDL